MISTELFIIGKVQVVGIQKLARSDKKGCAAVNTHADVLLADIGAQQVVINIGTKDIFEAFSERKADSGVLRRQITPAKRISLILIAEIVSGTQRYFKRLIFGK